MKKEQTVWLFIVTFVLLFTTMSYRLITLRASRPTVELALDDRSVASSTVDINIKQNQSDIDEQRNISVETPNIVHPEVCIEQWQQDLMDIEDALHCIDDYKRP